MQAQSLKGQKALVTGASSGIGEAVAKALAGAGAAVMVNYSGHAEAGLKVEEEIRSAGGEALAIRADVRDETQVQAMFRKMFEVYETIDILVNNAGIQRDAPFHEMTLEEWDTMLSINLTGQFLCAREAVREFLRRGEDHLHFLSPRSYPVGWSCQLCCLQGRSWDAHEVDGTGTRPAANSCE